MFGFCDEYNGVLAQSSHRIRTKATRSVHLTSGQAKYQILFRKRRNFSAIDTKIIVGALKIAVHFL